MLASIVLPFISHSHADTVECNTRGTISAIPDAVWVRMQGTSWHSGMSCPARSELRYLRIPYLDFQRQPQSGEMIVAASVAQQVLSMFSDLYCSGDFLIDKMQLVSDYEGSDPLSMNANNTSAFNCRLTTNGNRLSEHSFGTAIDINPVQNPYVHKTTTQPAAGRDYNTPQKRAKSTPGVIREGERVVRAFAKIGWKWGGNWRNSKDYQHFSRSGR